MIFFVPVELYTIFWSKNPGQKSGQKPSQKPDQKPSQKPDQKSGHKSGPSNRKYFGKVNSRSIVKSSTPSIYVRVRQKKRTKISNIYCTVISLVCAIQATFARTKKREKIKDKDKSMKIWKCNE